MNINRKCCVTFLKIHMEHWSEECLGQRKQAVKARPNHVHVLCITVSQTSHCLAGVDLPHFDIEGFLDSPLQGLPV